MYQRREIARGLVGNRREETGNQLLEKRSPDGGSVDFGAHRALSQALWDAMKRTNHNSRSKSSRSPTIDLAPPPPPMLRPRRGVWWHPDGRVELMFRLDHPGSSYTQLVIEPPKDGALPAVSGKDAVTMIPLFATVKQAALLCGFRPKTFYNWIAKGQLREEHGLRRMGRDYRFDFRILKAAIDRGEVPSCL
jgi:hypothetical protein